MGRPHVVPLSDAGDEVARRDAAISRSRTDFVFPGAKRGTVINDATLRYLLQDMGYAGDRHHARHAGLLPHLGVGDHGLTTRRDRDGAWRTRKSELDAAYQRGELLDKRRRLMAAWADYLDGHAMSESATVLALRT